MPRRRSTSSTTGTTAAASRAPTAWDVRASRPRGNAICGAPEWTTIPSAPTARGPSIVRNQDPQPLTREEATPIPGQGNGDDSAPVTGYRLLGRQGGFPVAREQRLELLERLGVLRIGGEILELLRVGVVVVQLD